MLKNVTIAFIALSMLAVTGTSLSVSPGNAVGAAPSGASLAPAMSAVPMGTTGPTATGASSAFGLSGPTLVAPSHGTAAASTGAGSLAAFYPQNSHLPSSNPRAAANSHRPSSTAATDPASLIPTVSCQPLGAGCDPVTSTNGGALTNGYAQNATQNGGLYGFDIEPPDQALCAGGGYVVEGINIGEVQVFHTDLTAASPPISLDSLMGLTALNYSSGGDVACLYDPSNGGHWFIVEFVSTTSEAVGGTFAGCFAGVYDTCREGIAVSETNNPLGSYYVYFLDPNSVNSDPGQGYLLNDFTKIGNTRDAFLLFYDEFNLNGATIPACPAFGCLGFNGAQEFAFQKSALEHGRSTVHMAYVNMGLMPTPDGSCNTAVFSCWYEVIPAATPMATQFDNHHDGSGFMVASLDFFGSGDTRIAVFDWTHLGALNSAGCGSCGGITFGEQLFTGLQSYLDEGVPCPAALGSYCGLAPQKAGPIPLGDNCVKFSHLSNGKCSEGGIESNGDGATEASYNGGQIWTAVSTLVDQTFGSASELHIGAAYWAFGTSSFNSGGPLTLSTQGYVSAAHEDIVYPTIAAGVTTGQGAVISFSLSGNGGPTGVHHGGYYPSSAFGRLTLSSDGLVGSHLYISALGQSPQDGFSEYDLVGTPYYSPRWGDYGAAVFVPGLGFYFASEYIQHPNCGPTAFIHDPTCGGTRDPYANFGTSVNLVVP